MRALVLCLVADDTCARQRVVRRRRVTGSPRDRDVSRRGEGLPGAWAVLFVRAMVEHPAGYVPLLAHLTERPLWPSGNSAPWASGKVRGFGAACPWPTRSRTYASPGPFLRPSQGSLPAWAGSPLAGRVLHPLDDTQSFMKASPPPIPFDQPCLVTLNFLYPFWATCPLGGAKSMPVGKIFSAGFFLKRLHGAGATARAARLATKGDRRRAAVRYRARQTRPAGRCHPGCRCNSCRTPSDIVGDR